MLRRTSPARPVWVVLTAVGALVLLVLVAPRLDPLTAGPGGLLGGAPDAAVSLPRSDEVDPATPRERVGPQPTPRLWCQPQGCLAWRAMLPVDQTTVVVSGGLVVALDRDDDALVALDAATGEHRWTIPMPQEEDLRRQAEATGLATADIEPRLFPAEDGVYVAGPGWLAHVDADAVHRWSAAAPRDTWWARPSGEVTLFHGTAAQGPEVGPHEHLAAHDAATGRLRWERHVWGMPTVLDGGNGVVAGTREDRLGRIDTATGEVIWEIEVMRGGWSPSFGDWVLATLPDGRRALVDPADGTRRTAPYLDGDIYGLASIEGLHVLLVVIPDETDGPAAPQGPDRPADGDAEVVALGDEGLLRWRFEFTADTGYACCPALVIEGDEVLLRGRRIDVVLDAETGEQLRTVRTRRRPSDLARTFTVDGLRFTHHPDRLAVETETGHVTVLGDPSVWVVGTDPLVIAREGEVLGVRLER